MAHKWTKAQRAALSAKMKKRWVKRKDDAKVVVEQFDTLEGHAAKGPKNPLPTMDVRVLSFADGKLESHTFGIRHWGELVDLFYEDYGGIYIQEVLVTTR